MSGVSLRLLFDTRADDVAAAAQTWLALADDLGNACEDLIRGTRDLEHVWPSGPAAEAAHRRAADLRAEAGNAYLPARRIGLALREHADSVRGLQNSLRDITTAAAGQGLQVDIDAGTVSAPQHMYTDSTAPHVVAQLVNAYVHQLEQVLAQATGLDSRTTAVLNGNLPDTPTGFGTLSLPPVSEATLREQQGRPPADVHAWWRSLTPQQQEQAINDHPRLVGWIDGIPAQDRNTANRLFLSDRQAALQAEEDALRARLLSVTPRSGEDYEIYDRLRRIDTEQAELRAVDKALTKLGDRGFLLGVDPAGDGKVVIAVGNPDTAGNAAVWVPGLGTTLQGNTMDNVERMIWLNDAADRLTPTRAGDVSTVYWLGYDAPDLNNLSVAQNDRSLAGAQPYATFMQGMRATHEGPDHHLTAMGHSYGSTVVGEAALTGRLPVDDLVTAGSPGTHATNAGQLMADPRHVWAGSADNDPVSQTSNVTNWTTAIPIVGPFISQEYEDGHNISPHYPGFGANQYRVDTSGHTNYWEPGSESLNNQAKIVMGKYDYVTLEHGQKPQGTP